MGVKKLVFLIFTVFFVFSSLSAYEFSHESDEKSSGESESSMESLNIKSHNHNGLFIRGKIGGTFAYFKSIYDDGPTYDEDDYGYYYSSSQGDSSLKGGGLMLTLDIGWSLGESFILGGEIIRSETFGSYSDCKGEDCSESSFVLEGLALGFNYYFLPSNSYFAMYAGISRFKVEAEAYDITYSMNSDLGFLVSLSYGKEWWVTDNIGVGVSGQFTYSFNKMSNYYEADGYDFGPFDRFMNSMITGLFLSVTYN